MNNTSTSTSTSTSTMYGIYKGTVESVVINLTGNRPAIYTRITGTKDALRKEVTHTVRLRGRTAESTKALIEIGIGELCSAFPELLPQTGTEEVLTVLLTQTEKFIGKPCGFSIEEQLNEFGKPKINPKTKSAYYNIRMESAMANLSKESAAPRIAAFMATQENVETSTILAELAQQSHPG